MKRSKRIIYLLTAIPLLVLLTFALVACKDVADNFKSAGKIIVNDCEKTLRVKPKLSRSVYVYEIEVFNGIAEFDLVVDGKTGLVTIE